MSPDSFNLYSKLLGTGTVAELIPLDQLRDQFPNLRLNDTADFNHFWFYSAISAAIARFFQSFGIDVAPHTAFILQHALLFLAACLYAAKNYGKLGFAVVLLLTLASPMLWFIDKVHTEFFTYSLALVAVMAVGRRKFSVAAVFLAIASTQNPPFALLAAFCLLSVLPRWWRNGMSLAEGVQFVATLLITALHPLYYLFRYGVPTPQMLAGGVDLGADRSIFYVWLIDPDVGLLPNWPLGIVTLGALMLATRRRLVSAPWSSPLFYFSCAYLCVNLFAQSSTTVLNSGATPGLSRYATWYIPLFFPITYNVMRNLRKRPVISIAAMGLCLLYLIASVAAYRPDQAESYLAPSPASHWIQKYLPKFYNPPAEIFLTRYSGRSMLQASPLQAVVGPSCDKAIVIPGPSRTEVFIPSECGIEAEKIVPMLNELRAKITRPIYINFERENFKQEIEFRSSYSMSRGGYGTKLLREGWHSPEEWGVWARLTDAYLVVPCTQKTADQGFQKLGLAMVAYVPTEAKGLNVQIRSQTGRALWSGTIPGHNTTIADIELSASDCTADGLARLTLTSGATYSPAAQAAGASRDKRRLGVGLLSVVAM